MSTQGDRIADRPLAEVGGKGLFVKELEQALSEGRADLAVHSAKDVPYALPDGFALSAFPLREDPRDALVAPLAKTFANLPRGARVGTSSLRRAVQLPADRPDSQPPCRSTMRRRRSASARSEPSSRGSPAAARSQSRRTPSWRETGSGCARSSEGPMATAASSWSAPSCAALRRSPSRSEGDRKSVV